MSKIKPCRLCRLRNAQLSLVEENVQLVAHLTNQASQFFTDESGSSFTEVMLVALIIAVIFALALLAVGMVE